MFLARMCTGTGRVIVRTCTVVSEQLPKVYFSDYFGVDWQKLDRYGAFDISLVTDLPLFIDPFLPFNSRRLKYRQLHDEIIRYLKFLRDKAEDGEIPVGLLRAWFHFPEVKQTWLGFTQSGNRGRGLGRDFAVALHQNLNQIFDDFGRERITKGSHLEKLCLIKEGVGRDNISDFTTNLINGFLCESTQEFAQRYVQAVQRRRVTVRKVQFNYETETWEAAVYELPWANGDYVLLTPRDILTKDDTWINKTDLVEEFQYLPDAVPNEELRSQINSYFLRVLPRRRRKEPTQKERRQAAIETISRFPVLIDAYIRRKEDRGDRAESVSAEKVAYSQELYVLQFQQLRKQLILASQFYRIAGDTYHDAHQRVASLKDMIENKGGHRFFYVKGRPIEREEDVQIAYGLTWFGTISDVSREVNDGRGPADFKISRGSKDKTIVEFKLASNSQLRRNLRRQAEVYQGASDARRAIKVIIYFTRDELRRVTGILKELGLSGSPDVVLIDARRDNKPSGSRA
jgi:hypothetical protein